LRHAATIVEAHIRYLKQTKPAGWQEAAAALRGWAKLLEGLRRCKLAKRRAQLEQQWGGASGADAAEVSRWSPLTERHLETLRGLAEAFAGMSRALAPMPWLWWHVLLAAMVEGVLEGLRAASPSAVDPGSPQATKLRQGLAGMMQRPPGRKPLPPEAEAAYQEWRAARREDREISARELAERYLGPEYEANPEAAVRKMRRWLQRARVYYGDAD